MLSRLLLLALVDSTAWAATKQLNYSCRATDVLMLFVLRGSWTLVLVAHQRATRRSASVR